MVWATSAYMILGNDFVVKDWFKPGNHIEITMKNIPKVCRPSCTLIIPLSHMPSFLRIDEFDS
jgi:hypothetical protein